MPQNRFDIGCTNGVRYWSEIIDGQIAIHSGATAEKSNIITSWDLDTLYNLLNWATSEGQVVSLFTGPLAHQIRKYATHLGMTPEMFVWHAVKVFIEIGSDNYQK